MKHLGPYNKKPPRLRLSEDGTLTWSKMKFKTDLSVLATGKKLFYYMAYRTKPYGGVWYLNLRLDPYNHNATIGKALMVNPPDESKYEDYDA